MYVGNIYLPAYGKLIVGKPSVLFNDTYEILQEIPLSSKNNNDKMEVEGECVYVYQSLPLNDNLGCVYSNIFNNKIYHKISNHIVEMQDYHPSHPIRDSYGHIFPVCQITGKQSDLIILDGKIVHKDMAVIMNAVRCEKVLFEDETMGAEKFMKAYSMFAYEDENYITGVYATQYVTLNNKYHLPRQFSSMLLENLSYVYDYMEQCLLRYSQASNITEDFLNNAIRSNNTNLFGDDRTFIKNYNYTPDRFIINDLRDANKTKNKNTYTVGLEIEVECPKNNRKRISFEANQLSRKEKLFYIVHDGSLSNGMEIVTMPFKVNRYNGAEKIVKELGEILGYLNTEGNSFIQPTCGLHIHIGREGLAEGTIAKLQYIFDIWWDELKKFSKRDRVGYTNKLNFLYNLYAKKDRKNCIFPVLYGVREESSKYFCVNTQHKHTIEIRLWSGSQSPEEIEAYIEMTMILFNLAQYKTIDELRVMEFGEIYNLSNNKNFKKIFKDRM